jgi:hypothetical protein
MAKVQMVLLNVLAAIFTVIFFIARKPYITDDIAILIALLVFLLLLALVIISIISIFHSVKLVKQKDEEKLRKSAGMVKLSTIPFWIILPILFIDYNFWYHYEIIIMLLSLYIPLLGTSVFSIAYVQLLYKKKKLTRARTIVYTLLQLCFFLDIVSTLYLRYTKKNKRGAKNKKSNIDSARFFLNSLRPAHFAETLANVFKQGPVPRIARKVGAFFVSQWTVHRVRCYAFIAVLFLCFAFPFAYNVYQSSKPQPIKVTYRIQVPGTTRNPDTRPPLSVSFKNSVASSKMKDKKVPAGRILIDPPIEGAWQWRGTDKLIFSTGQEWQAGKRYTVTFSKNLFPSHIIMNKSFSFNIESFSLRIIEKEFKIDGEDGSDKRVSFTVQANYPVDTASLETHISIEPQISADSGSLKKQPYRFSAHYNDSCTRAYIVSEPLGIPVKTARIRLSIAEGVRDSSGNGNVSRNETASIEIPGMTGFVRVKNMNHELVRNDRQIYENVLSVVSQGTIDSAELSKNIAAWALPANYDWINLNEVTPRVLASSRRINLEAIPNEQKYSSYNSWRFRAEPGQYMYVRLNSGARFYGGYILDTPYETIFRVQFPPEER